MWKLIVYRVRLAGGVVPPAEEKCQVAGAFVEFRKWGDAHVGLNYAFGADFSGSVVVALACETYVVPNTRSQNGLVTPAACNLGQLDVVRKSRDRRGPRAYRNPDPAPCL